MTVFRPSELRQFLDNLGVRAKKSLSQNFLIDGNILRKIVSAANVTADDLIIEIGPGPGALTEFLLGTGARVIAIEKDAVFAKALHRLQNERLGIFANDALNFDLSPHFAHGHTVKVVANLPYQLTSPLLEKLAPLAPHVQSLTLMVQKEVAERMIASPGTHESSSLSLFLALFAKTRLCFNVEPTCFYPRPKVRSAVVHLDLNLPPDNLCPKDFLAFARIAFSMRRKTLRASLRSQFASEKIISGLQILQLDENARPENLSLEQFIQLYRYLTPTGA